MDTLIEEYTAIMYAMEIGMITPEEEARLIQLEEHFKQQVNN